MVHCLVDTTEEVILESMVDRQSNNNMAVETEKTTPNNDLQSEMQSCHLCNKAFFLKTSLEKHLENHPVVSVVPMFKPKKDVSVVEENLMGKEDLHTEKDATVKNEVQGANSIEENVAIKEEGEECGGSESTDKFIHFVEIKNVLNNDGENHMGIENEFSDPIVEKRAFTGVKHEDIDDLVNIVGLAPLPALKEENKVNLNAGNNVKSEEKNDSKLLKEAHGPPRTEESNSVENFPHGQSTMNSDSNVVDGASSMKSMVPELPVLEIKPRDFNCSLCPEVFSEESDLSKHFQLEHQIPEQELGFNFKSKTGPLILSKARSISKFTCRICGAVFVRKQSLNLHIKSRHPEILNKCNLCQKSFVAKCSLLFHKRWHSRVNKFLKVPQM